MPDALSAAVMFPIPESATASIDPYTCERNGVAAGTCTHNGCFTLGSSDGECDVIHQING